MSLNKNKINIDNLIKMVKFWEKVIDTDDNIGYENIDDYTDFEGVISYLEKIKKIFEDFQNYLLKAGQYVNMNINVISVKDIIQKWVDLNK